MTEGKKLIEKMTQEQKLSTWGEPDLESYLENNNKYHGEKFVEFISNSAGQWVNLSGIFDIAELEAMIITLANSKGQWIGQ